MGRGPRPTVVRVTNLRGKRFLEADGDESFGKFLVGPRVVDDAPHLRHHSPYGHEPVLFGHTVIIVFDLVGVAQPVVRQDKIHLSVSEWPLACEGMKSKQTRAVFLGGTLRLGGR